MISFIQLPYRRLPRGEGAADVGPWGTAVVLALIVCFQIGLLVWVFLGHWGS